MTVFMRQQRTVIFQMMQAESCNYVLAKSIKLLMHTDRLALSYTCSLRTNFIATPSLKMIL